MLKLISTIALSMILGVGAYGVTPAMSMASSGQGGPSAGGPSAGGPSGSGGGAEDPKVFRVVPKQRENYRKKPMHDGCSDSQALHAASGMGLGGAYVAFSGERTISVFGRASGGVVRVRFNRASGCPVISGGW